MGGTTSKIYGKLSRSWTSASCSSENYENASDMCRSPSSVGPFVFTRRGSQFFDEDGDLAHEFYEEEPVDDPFDVEDECDPNSISSFSSNRRGRGGGEEKEEPAGKRTRRIKMRMRRKFRNLSPQGIVKLQFPRLHGDLPVVLCHVSPSQWTIFKLRSPSLLACDRTTVSCAQPISSNVSRRISVRTPSFSNFVWSSFIFSFRELNFCVYLFLAGVRDRVYCIVYSVIIF